jgi:hypothetical protein
MDCRVGLFNDRVPSNSCTLHTMKTHDPYPIHGSTSDLEPAPTTNRRAAWVVSGTLAGSLLLPLLMASPGLFMAAVLGWFQPPATAESSQLGRWVQGLVADWWGPWGLIGALAGGGFAWNRTRLRSDDNQAHLVADQATRGLLAGEGLLASGVVFLVLAAGVFPSVMIWMLGLFYIAPVALLLCILGILRARGRQGTGLRRGAGLLLLALGLAALAWAALAGSTLSYLMVVPAQYAPAPWNLPSLLSRWILPLPILWVGLRFWTDWSISRLRAWGTVFFLVPLAALLVHRTLVTLGFLPLSA